MDKDVLREMIEEGLSLEAIGERVGKHPSTVAYWLKKHGLDAVNADRHRERGGIAREELEALIAEGLTIREIAARLDRAYSTVRHWLGRHGLQTRPAERRESVRAIAPGDRFLGQCRHHGEAVFVKRLDGASACVRCRSEAVSARRRRVKERLVAEAGGACAICAYDRCVAALQFHHLDPTTKRFTVTARRVSWEQVREEASKCVLLCANCHAEVEAGVVAVPS
jgi:transposase